MSGKALNQLHPVRDHSNLKAQSSKREAGGGTKKIKKKEISSGKIPILG